MLAVAAVGLGACAAGDPTELADLEERVAILEVEVAEATTTDTAERIAELESDITDLTQALAETSDARQTLADDLGDANADIGLLLDAVTVLEEELALVGDELRAQLDSLAGTQQQATADLDRRLAGVSGQVDRATSDLEELRTIIVTVRDRLDRCQADGSC